MKPPPFKYLAPDSVEEALEMLVEHGDEAKLLAGGQSLVPAMNFRVVQPAVLIDLNRIEALAYISANDELRIGAMTSQRAVELSPMVERTAPLLHETMPEIAHPQIRNRGTLGGSLAHADPAAELPVIAITSNARMRSRGPYGDRWIEARDFFQGMFVTALAPDEMLVEIVFPSRQPGTGWSFKEVSRRRGDYAMMGVAIEVEIDSDEICQTARIVYLNAGDGPLEATDAAESLIGERPGPELFEHAAVTASEQEIAPFGSLHASEEFQRHLARVLTVRSLETAVARAVH